MFATNLAAERRPSRLPANPAHLVLAGPTNNLCLSRQLPNANGQPAGCNGLLVLVNLVGTILPAWRGTACSPRRMLPTVVRSGSWRAWAAAHNHRLACAPAPSGGAVPLCQAQQARVCRGSSGVSNGGRHCCGSCCGGRQGMPALLSLAGCPFRCLASPVPVGHASQGM